MDMLTSSKNSLVSFQIANLEVFSGSPFLAISVQMAANAVWEQNGKAALMSENFLLLESVLFSPMAAKNRRIKGKVVRWSHIETA